jgi:hypothetical protein
MMSANEHAARSASTQSLPATPGFTPVLVLGDLDAYYNIPTARVIQVPERLLPLESLVLCPAFDPAFPSVTKCPLGAACRHVHADVTGLPLIEVHVNYAWRSLEDVAYPRHEAGSTVQVAPPNTHRAIDTMDTGLMLRTRALSAPRRPLSHCAHYYFNRECNLGCECRFVHAVFIDPAAQPHRLRRAPAPSQLGRGPKEITTTQRSESPDWREMKATLRSESPGLLSTQSGTGLATDRRVAGFLRPPSADVLCHTESRSIDSLRAGSGTPIQMLPEMEPLSASHTPQRVWKHQPYDGRYTIPICSPSLSPAAPKSVPMTQ